MTETTFTAAPRLVRPRGTTLRGVCTALANYTSTDVVLWRVIFVVLLLFGLVGIPLYLLGIFVIPADGEPTSLARRLLDGPDRHLTNGQVVFLALLVLTTVGLLHNGPGSVVLLVALGLGFLWWRGQSPPPAVGSATAVGSTTDAAPVVAATQVPSTPPPPRPVRPRSPLGGVTAGLAVVTAGTLLLLDAADVVDVPLDVVLASALAVVGLGLVVGSFLGRSIGLVLLALGVSAALIGTVAVRPVLDAGVGERTWTPTGPATYKLGVGEATLDLSQVVARETDAVGIDARVEVGHLIVLVPDGVRVSLTAKTDFGNVEVFGDQQGGRTVSRVLDLGPTGSPQLRLDLHVHTGDLEVRHA